jgi:hypothetical protein
MKKVEEPEPWMCNPKSLKRKSRSFAKRIFARAVRRTPQDDVPVVAKYGGWEW